jgi:hypothetical protein
MTTRGDDPPGGRRGAGIALVVGATLAVLVVAAAVGSGRSDLGEGPSPIVSDILGGAIVGGFGGLVLIGTWLLLFRRGGVVRIRPAAPTVPWWVRSLVAIVLFVLVVVVGLLVFGRRDEPRERRRADPAAEESSSDRSSTAPDDQRNVSVAFYAGLALAGAVVVIGIARAGGRKEPSVDGYEPEEDEVSPAEMLLTAVDESLDALEGEPDPRRAIVAAYVRVQAILARDGMPRRISETEPEYLRRVLRHYGAAAEPARRLTELFERARYGVGVVDEGMRTEAIAAARAIRDGATVRSGR